MLKRVLPLIALLFVACGNGDKPDDYCVGVDCGGNGHCVVGADGPICVCDDGFTLQDDVCKESPMDDPCKDVVCEGNGACEVVGGETAVCKCRPGYHSEGAKCVKDDEEPEAPCEGVTCGGHGSCVVNDSGAAVCVCYDGYRLEGDDCVEIVDPCSGITCSGHGTCEVDDSGAAVCVCDDGYRFEGDDCVEIIDPCSGITCSGHGTCEVNDSGAAVCVCYDGYRLEGDDCVEIIDPCSGITCSGHGTCEVDDSGAASCNCDTGYTRYGNFCLKFNDCEISSNCSDGWCLISTCTFQMGSPDEEQCRDGDEGPVHSATISREFYMQQTEVTQGEWSALIGNNPSQFSDCGDNCPVEMVNWYDAVYYANQLSTDEGFESCYTISGETGTPGTRNYSATVTFKGLDCKGYRLPTEAEWEFAARAGTTTTYWVGDNVAGGEGSVCGYPDPPGISLPEVAWYGYNSSGTTHPTAEKLANPFGLYDVYGNVSEWTNDWYSAFYYDDCSGGCTDPMGPPTGGRRVNRGGSWQSGTIWLRSAARWNGDPKECSDQRGFRLARTAPQVP